MTAAAHTLGVFAKRPVPGAVKTRLAAETSPEWAASVAAAFLHDTLDRLATVEARRVLVFAPADVEPYFRELARGRFELTPQSNGDLGQRMATFFREQFEAGAARVVLVGTDCPTMPPEVVRLAFFQLEYADLLLGPAADGGYYLIGCRKPIPGIFEGIAWGGPHVLHDTVARLPAGYRLSLLATWYDVDTLADWFALRGQVAAERRVGLDPGVPHTEAVPPPPR